MSEKEKILKENFTEYYSLALESFEKKKYNCATTLFFKSMVTLIDLYILKKEGFIPSSHTDRFKILQEKYPELYKIADIDLPYYQDSYTKKMNKEAANLLKEDVERIKKTLGI